MDPGRSFRGVPESDGGTLRLRPSTLLAEVTGALESAGPAARATGRGGAGAGATASHGASKSVKLAVGPPATPEIIELLNIADYTDQVTSVVDIDRPLFNPTPSSVVFKTFEAHKTRKVLLSMRNNDAVARRVKIQPPDSPYFSVSAPRPAKKGQKLVDGKVAAGMEVCFVITFSPAERRDYKYDLVCVTEREKFVVPIRAVGPRACLTFPDEVLFPPAPVKHPVTKSFVVRNVGDAPAQFVLSTDAPFSVEPRTGTVGVEESCQIAVAFVPTEARDFGGELVVQYAGDGPTVFVDLRGSAENINVSLSVGQVKLAPAYITLTTQSRVKIYNRSDVPVKFEWRSLQRRESEEAERERLRLELDRMETMERRKINEDARERARERQGEKGSEDDGPGDIDSDLSDTEDGVPAGARAELAALARKYRNLRRQVDEDQLLFTDDAFAIEPASGEIWAHSDIDVTIKFCPQTAADYLCTAFLEIGGRETRLPLEMVGAGIGPKAAFSYDVLDIGDVFVGSEHQYELMLENQGEIEAHYSLQAPASPFGPKFTFEPSAGTLGVGETHAMTVTFCSDILGEFSEQFTVVMQGSSERLTVHFKGHVVGPTFHLDCDEIDFGVVAFEFLNTHTLHLYNTSSIPMRYNMRIPQDGKYLKKEFDIVPATGTVLPEGRQQIKVDFISTTVQDYDMYLTVDVEGVGEGLLSIPVRATCVVPEVSLQNPQVQYEDCFVRYPYKQPLTIVNHGTQAARYQVLDQDEHTEAVAAFEADEPRGTVPPESSTTIQITLACEKLGRINLPVHVRISGSEGPPLLATLQAMSVGPCVEPSKPEVNWGKIPCLEDIVEELELHNNSLIPAPFKTFIKSARSKFAVDIKEGVLAPDERLTLRLIAHLDDTTNHKDQLHVLVTEGENLIVPLKARGVGTTVHCDAEISVLDFGSQFTSTTCERTVMLENKGRRAQTLTWVNVTCRDRDLEAKAAAAKKDKGKTGRKTVVPEPSVPIFTVEPESIELKPCTACMFRFKGLSSEVGAVTEVLECIAKVAKDKGQKPIFRSEVSADFIHPLLEPSAPSLHFNYMHSNDIALASQTQPMTLRNVSKLPLFFVLRTAQPFSLDRWEFQLQPDEEVTVNVEFDPGYKDDCQSHVAEKKLTAVYRDHPRRDAWDLIGEVNFPNVEFEYTRVDFGTVLNDTTKSTTVRVTNPSKIDCALSWSFVQDEDAERAAATSRRPFIPVNQVFDILPIRSYLRPGESDVVEFIFYGHANRKFKALSVCEVEGGPEYEMTLVGEASTLGYRLDRQFLDFGKIIYDKSEEREFFLHNTGKVAFNYSIRTDLVTREGVVSVSPTSGRVFAGDKQRITVKFQPGIPERITERLVIEVAHFEPCEFPIHGQGIYAAMCVSLPREVEDAEDWDLALVAARHRLMERLDTPDRGDGLQAIEAGTGRMSSLRTARSMQTGATESKAKEAAARPESRVSAAASLNESRPPSVAGGGDEANSVRGSVADGAPVPPLPSVPSVGSGTAQREEPGPLEIETEAARVDFLNYLLAEEARVAAADAAVAEAAGGSEDGIGESKGGDSESKGKEDEAGAKKSGTKRRQSGPRAPSVAGSAAGRRAPGLGRKPMKFSIGTFTADFGNVVRGQSRKKTFKVTNTGLVPLSFELPSKAAQALGFVIEPAKVVRVPEGESVEFTAVFHAVRNKELGPVSMNMPVNIRNGPTVILALRANITIPELRISPDNHDFGAVRVGREKEVAMQFHNVAPVPTDWELKRPTGSAQTKDLAYFRLEPDSGTLQPGERVIVKAIFTPRDARPYQLKIPIKLANNPKSRSITLRGTGETVEISFDPPLTSLGPVLPFAEHTTTRVDIVNDTDHELEIYSLDFDPTFLREEEILRRTDGYDDNEVLRLPPRDPGAELPDFVLEAEAARVAAEEKQRRIDAGEDVEGEGDGEADAPGDDDEVGDVEAVEDILAGELTPRAQGRALNIVVWGPPVSGCSTVAKSMAERWNACLLTLDEVVAWGKKNATALGEDLHTRLLEALDPDALLSPEELAEKQAAEEAAAKKKKKPKKGEPEPEPVKLTATPELLAEIVRERVRRIDCAYAVFFDGFGGECVASPMDGLRAIHSALGYKSAGGLKLVVLKLDDEELAARHEAVRAEAQRVVDTNGAEPSPRPSDAEDGAEGAEDAAAVEAKGDEAGEDGGEAEGKGTEDVDGAAADEAPQEPAETPEEREARLAAEAAARVEAAQRQLARLDAVAAAAAAEGAAEPAGDEEAARPSAFATQLEEVIELVTQVATTPRAAEPETGNGDEFEGAADGADRADGEAGTEESKEAAAKAVAEEAADPEVVAHEAEPADSAEDGVEGDEADEGGADEGSEGDLPPIIETDASEPADMVIAQTMAMLPDLPEDGKPESEDLILPDPVVHQLIRRPTRRPARKPVTLFRIVRADGPEPTEEELAAKAAEEAEAKAAADAAAAKGKKGKKGAAEPEPETEPVEEEPEVMRWVLPPHSRTPIKVQFAAEEVGSFDAALGFEIVGSAGEYSLFSRGQCAVPTISTDPRNVFMSRAKGRREGQIISKKYITQLGKYEFGPLLAGKNPESKGDDGVAATNSERFRITNNGDFEVDVDFGIGGTATSGEGGDTVFSVEPERLQLAAGDTEEITVWAFPQEAEQFDDTVVCCVKDNPGVVEFPVSCLGAVPVVELHGPWEEEKKEEKEPEPEPEPKGKKGKKAAKGKAAAPPEPEGPVIDFDRLLLKRSEEKQFTLQSKTSIPVDWRLDLSEIKDSEEFDVFPAEGTLQPFGTAKLTVSFAANEEAELLHNINVEFADGEQGLPGEDEEAEEGRVQRLPLALKGEAYKITPYAKFDDEDEAKGTEDGEQKSGEFDYGVVKCGSSETRGLTLANQGKYPIKFRVFASKRATRKLFSIEPEEGELKPEDESRVEVTFLSHRELQLKHNKDVRVQIMDGRSGEVVEEFPLSVSARTVFSKTRTIPMRGINFGAVQYGEERERTFEIKNDGEFDIDVQLVAVGSDEDNKLLERVERDATAAREGVPIDASEDEAPPTAPIQLGPYTVEPQGATVAPGTNMTVTVKFAADGAEVFRETLRVHVSGRDPSEDQGAYLYELVGESCIPGIAAEDFEGIFEEQAVVRELDPSNEAARVFGRKDRTFTFGHIVPSSHPQGVIEKFKITNPNKIPCKVALKVEPKGDTPEDTFTVQPAALDLPSHEHRYIDVYFKPKAMRQYSASFSADVEAGTDDKTKRLQFSLSGEGTLPCMTVTDPTTRSEDGILEMDFGRKQVGKSKTRSITLLNNGVVAATARFDMAVSDHFKFPERNASVRLEPGESKTVELTYEPLSVSAEDAPHTANVRLVVMQNAFESTTVRLTGTCFEEAVTFEGLPEATSDTLTFPSLVLEGEMGTAGGEDDAAATPAEGEEEAEKAALQSTEATFSLLNHRPTPVRFVWADSETVVMEPKIGHLMPHEEKSVTAIFSARAPMKLDPAEAAIDLQLQPITVADGHAAVGWDDQLQTVRFEEGKKGEPRKRVVESQPEPEYEAAGEEINRSLKLEGVADYVRYECEASAVTFRPTMMFQARSYSFPVKNPGTTELRVSWKLLDRTRYASRPGTAKSGAAAAQQPAFSITPHVATIAAGGEQTFTVRFAPMEVEEYAAACIADIPGLAEDVKPLRLSLAGRAQRPICHFDLKPTDYLERRSADMVGPTGQLGPLEPGIRVVEFRSLGTRVRNTARFMVVNPMNSSYEFVWEAVGASNPAFRCVSQKGIVLAGRRYEMVFEFTPEDVGASEAFFRFAVPQHGISQLFLFAGDVIEPRVSLSRVHINFREHLVGARVTETLQLINEEILPFQFTFDTSAFGFGGSGSPPLAISPTTGVVPANGRLPIEVAFTPAEEKPHNFNVACRIHKKPTQLSLNVKGEGYAVHERLVLQEAGGGIEREAELSSESLNVLDFGHVHLNERAIRRVAISNTGKVNFDFVWRTEGKRNPMFTVTPEVGKVGQGQRAVCAIEFRPVADTRVDGLKLSCTVGNMRTYNLSVSARGARPALDFSFDSHDFGPCFIPVVPGAPTHPESTVLRVTNNDLEQDIGFECLFEKKPYLDVQAAPTVLRPGEAVEIPVVFAPRTEGAFSEVIPFEINGVLKHNVMITGEGTRMRVELEDSSKAAVAFGTLQVGKEAARTVRVVNRSKRPATFSLSEVQEAGKGRLEERSIRFSPAGPVTLKPRESVLVEVRFSPMQRIAAFSEQLLMTLAGDTRPLLTVSGACQGIDVKLETDVVAFGPVCVGSRLTRRFEMHNTGDIGTKFQWHARAFGPDFSVSPATGFLAPQSDASIAVTFHPTSINDDIRYEGLLCDVEGTEPLQLTLLGEGVAQPDSDEAEIAFDAAVRTEVKQTISLPKNPSNGPWRLRPVVENPFWTGAESVEVAAGATGSYELTYRPLSMTSEDEESERPAFHSGSVFVALPDGTAVRYSLKGTASEPECSGTVTKEAPAKSSLTVPLRVDNWLQETQRFHVTIDLAEGTEPSTFLRGAETLDVPQNGTREYKLGFYAYKEGKTTGRVTFTNPKTGEFLFYDVELTATAPGVVETISLEAPVRQSVKRVVTVENPLPADSDADVEFGEPVCDDPCVRVRVLGAMAGKPEGAFEVEYRPLLATDEPHEVNLKLASPALGDYTYKLRLNASVPGMEPSLQFKAALGAKHTQIFRFTNYVGAPTDYSCSVEKPEYFIVDPVVKAPASEGWDGTEVELEVAFEPEGLGSIRDTLTVQSATGGVFTCPLIGTSTMPRPQGPFPVADGGSVTVEFTNVFNDAREFRFVTDNPCFAVSAAAATVQAKKPQAVTVKYTPQEGARTAGKLQVTCPTAPDVPPWIYYLEGGANDAAGGAGGKKKGKK